MADQRAEAVVAEFHPRPSGHFVFNEATWADMKKRFHCRDDESIAGQRGVSFDGTPVYIDACPWDCS